MYAGSGRYQELYSPGGHLAHTRVSQNNGAVDEVRDSPMVCPARWELKRKMLSQLWPTSDLLVAEIGEGTNEIHS